METWIDLTGSRHYELLSRLAARLDGPIQKILDAGSGRTSLSVLLQLFPASKIDAIVFYNDMRKIRSIQESVVSDRYALRESDICVDAIAGVYDLVLAHLLLGEALKWGHSVEDLLEKLTSIHSKRFIIFDFKEDTSIGYDDLEHFLQTEFITIAKDEIAKGEPQAFKNFIGKTYIAYLLERK